MTDREDGASPRGPRRYGPRATGQPGSAGDSRPPTTPRGDAEQPGGIPDQRRRGASDAARRAADADRGAGSERWTPDAGRAAGSERRAPDSGRFHQSPHSAGSGRGAVPPRTSAPRAADNPRNADNPRAADYPRPAGPPLRLGDLGGSRGTAPRPPHHDPSGRPAAPLAWSATDAAAPRTRSPRNGTPPRTAPTHPDGSRPAAGTATSTPPARGGSRPAAARRTPSAAPAGYQRRTTTPPPATPGTHPHPKLWIGRLVAVVLSITVLVATGFISFLADGAGQQEAGLITDCPTTAACAGTTILLVGSDARVDAEGNPLTTEELAAVATDLTDGGTSTDTMMLIHIPVGGGRATAVSIPRDSWIGDPPQGPSDSGSDLVDYSPNKVNSYYGSAKFYTQERMVAEGVSDRAAIERESSNAGRKMLISVLEKLTGAHIDNYAEVNLFGFYLLSNAIGGVPVCLINPVYDEFSGANFQAGPQEVQGTAALSFVRQRHGLPNGDLDRVRRQQAFLSGAISKVLSVGTLTDPAKLSALIDAANRSIVLSDGFNLLDLADQMSAMSSGNINFETIPTHGAETTTSKDALSIDPAEIKQLFTRIADPDAATSAAADTGATDAGATDTAAPTVDAASVDPSSVTVDVQNGTMTQGMAKTVSEQAIEAGFGSGDIGNYPDVDEESQQQTTSIHYGSGGEAAATRLQQDLGFGTLQADDAIGEGRLLVVVGLDRLGSPGLRAGGVATAATLNALAQLKADDTINAATPGCVN